MPGWYTRHCQFRSRCHRIDLRTARQFELVHRVERLLYGRAAGQQAMVAHDQRFVRAKIAYKSLALIKFDGRTFIVVITNVADEAD